MNTAQLYLSSLNRFVPLSVSILSPPMAALRSASALRLARLSAVPRRVARGLATARAPPSLFDSLDTFADRHVGPDENETSFMLSKLGYDSLDAFLAETVPSAIRIPAATINDASIPAFSESELHARAKALGRQNSQFKSYIGMGYHNAVVPPVILRNVSIFLLTPYHLPDIVTGHGEPRLVYPVYPVPAGDSPRSGFTTTLPFPSLNLEIGRLESLVNFQTMAASLTAMSIANASLLDEATAAAEGMVMAFAHSGQRRKSFFVDSTVLPQTIAVLRTRAKGFGIRLLVGDLRTALKDPELCADLAGVLLQYPDVNGQVSDYRELADQVHASGALVVCATDLLALTLLTPPGEWGADIVLGNSARFGVPAGYGGPHAAFFAVTDTLKRKMPGRLIGRSKDTMGNLAYRLALQSQ